MRAAACGRRRLAAVVGLAALALAGCATTTGTARQQMHEWASGASFDSDNQTIESDFASITGAIKERNLSVLHTVCAGFGADVQTLYGELPTPNGKLTGELNVALENNLEQSAIYCYDAPSFGSRKFAAFVVALARGKRDYAAAKRRLASFGVH